MPLPDSQPAPGAGPLAAFRSRLNRGVRCASKRPSIRAAPSLIVSPFRRHPREHRHPRPAPASPSRATSPSRARARVGGARLLAVDARTRETSHHADRVSNSIPAPPEPEPDPRKPASGRKERGGARMIRKTNLDDDRTPLREVCSTRPP